MEGRTVLFVTHNMGIITSLCPTVIWIEEGSVREHGSARAVVATYVAQRTPNQQQLVPLTHLQRPQAIQDDRLRLDSFEWLCDLPLQHGEPFKARINFITRSPVSDVSLGIGFSSYDGKRLLTYETDFQDGLRPSIARAGTYSVDIEVESLPLVPDIYALDIGSRSGDFHPLDYIGGSFQLEIIGGPKTPGSIIRRDGAVRLASKWLWRCDREAMVA